jgi:hypothetical protein
VHRDHAVLGERQHARNPRCDELGDRRHGALGRVQHHVAVAARLHDRAQHRGELGGFLRRACDENGLRLEEDGE